MYLNLIKEMEVRGYTQKRMAEAARMAESSLSDTLKGKRAFRFTEALAIRDELFPGMNLEYLFSTKKEEAVK